MNETQRKPAPPLPKFCRICKGELHSVQQVEGQERDSDGRYGVVVDYDIYTSKTKTIKYIYGCENDTTHTRLVVLENNSSDFRAVIREDRYDETRIRR